MSLLAGRQPSQTTTSSLSFSQWLPLPTRDTHSPEASPADIVNFLSQEFPIDPYAPCLPYLTARTRSVRRVPRSARVSFPLSPPSPSSPIDPFIPSATLF